MAVSDLTKRNLAFVHLAAESNKDAQKRVISQWPQCSEALERQFSNGSMTAVLGDCMITISPLPHITDKVAAVDSLLH